MRTRMAAVALTAVLILAGWGSAAAPAHAENGGGGGGGNSPTTSAGGFRIHSSVGTDGEWETCTLGFNVVRQNVHYFLTAGHCAVNNHYRWYRADGSYLGWTSKVSINKYYDYALMSYTSATPITKYGSVYIGGGRYADITTVASYDDMYNGQPVCFTGSTTGHHCGQITNKCFSDRQDTCVIKTNICVKKGDSGGPLYSGSAGLGIARSMDNGHSCQSLFSPLLRVLVAANQVGVY